jgi:hypothetical protein
MRWNLIGASLGLLLWNLPVHSAPDWQTRAEKTNFQETARYPETLAYAQRLAAASGLVELQTFGKSPEGRDLYVMVVSSDKAFTPEAAKATGKDIILINAGIHPGEIEGKDAGLALIREMVITGKYKKLLNHAIVLFIPIFGVDGHERFGAYNRINQNGPREMGWRTTAQNYNLNRDFLKADSPEMRGWLDLFARWLPDMIIDTHTTDGADYQYDLTYGLETHGNQNPRVVAWQKTAFEEHIFPALTKMGHKIAPYITLNDEKDPLKGFDDGVSTPRYSTGYGAIQNRPALLVETHMLKDYHNRVTATYDLLVEILNYIQQTPGQLHATARAADQDTLDLSKVYDPKVRYPLSFNVADRSIPFNFLGVAYTRELSAISGAMMIHYEPTKPITFTVPYRNQVEVERSVVRPLGYVIPVYLSEVIDRIKAQHLVYQTLEKPTDLEVETYKFTKVSWENQPFEHHHQIKDLEFTPVKRKTTYPTGSIIVFLSQRAANVAVHLLEPDSPDSLVRWGYLDQIFEAKEYAEDYVMEKVSRQMLAADPKLKAEFEAKVANEPDFAKSPSARLDFFYQRTPYYDERLNLYPIGRILPPF